MTKRKTYVLAPGAVGIPIEARHKTVPLGLEGMKIWQTEDGEVIARAEVEQNPTD